MSYEYIMSLAAGPRILLSIVTVGHTFKKGVVVETRRCCRPSRTSKTEHDEQRRCMYLKPLLHETVPLRIHAQLFTLRLEGK